MTAYELADKLDRYGEVSSLNKVWQAVKMLRQQADKIKMLEQECAAMREQLSYLESQVYGGKTK